LTIVTSPSLPVAPPLPSPLSPLPLPSSPRVLSPLHPLSPCVISQLVRTHARPRTATVRCPHSPSRPSPLALPTLPSLSPLFVSPPLSALALASFDARVVRRAVLMPFAVSQRHCKLSAARPFYILRPFRTNLRRCSASRTGPHGPARSKCITGVLLRQHMAAARPGAPHSWRVVRNYFFGAYHISHSTAVLWTPREPFMHASLSTSTHSFRAGRDTGRCIPGAEPLPCVRQCIVHVHTRCTTHAHTHGCASHNRHALDRPFH